MTEEEMLAELKNGVDQMLQKLVEIEQIFAVPSEPHCVFCRGQQQLTLYLSQYICQNCLRNINTFINHF